ncbi:DUF4224 domain-containing protein [Caballeronia telluris]|uniref:Uncharacterized protein n=1 Tax=Caballeronia telluris TaxID=326475 RepID=A0A158G300_9BURK|nr:DUF4224 domain-containing protein [Caballeronia telluris]SAL26303.1 hypothetical protein AWB66_01527 [Caballeronia telluris]
MSERLMTPEDLKRITGRVRYSKQAEWFMQMFGVEITRSFDGAPVMTWALYESLLARRAGLVEAGNDRSSTRKTKICSPFV